MPCTYVVLPSSRTSRLSCLCLYACSPHSLETPHRQHLYLYSSTTSKPRRGQPSIQLFTRTENFRSSHATLQQPQYLSLPSSHRFESQPSLRKRNHPTSPRFTFNPPPTPIFVSRSNPSNKKVIMCNYTQVEFECGHRRYTVRAWCTNYETTHRRCPPAVVAVEWRLNDRCGDCREPAMQPWMKYQNKNSRIQT